MFAGGEQGRAGAGHVSVAHQEEHEIFGAPHRGTTKALNPKSTSQSKVSLNPK
jgi:hypothetical protein